MSSDSSLSDFHPFSESGTSPPHLSAAGLISLRTLPYFEQKEWASSYLYAIKEKCWHNLARNGSGLDSLLGPDIADRAVIGQWLFALSLVVLDLGEWACDRDVERNEEGHREVSSMLASGLFSLEKGLSYASSYKASVVRFKKNLKELSSQIAGALESLEEEGE